MIARRGFLCWCGGDVGPRAPGDVNGLGCLDDVMHDWTLVRHARDIPDVIFLAAVARCQPRTPHGFGWAMRDDVAHLLEAPHKVVLAKFRRVNGRGLVDGCGCGCRGDWELTAAGRRRLVAALEIQGLHPEGACGKDCEGCVSPAEGGW